MNTINAPHKIQTEFIIAITSLRQKQKIAAQHLKLGKCYETRARGHGDMTAMTAHYSALEARELILMPPIISSMGSRKNPTLEAQDILFADM